MGLNHFAARHFRARHFGALVGALITRYIFNAIYQYQTEAQAVHWYQVALIAVYVLNDAEMRAVFEDAVQKEAVWDYEVLVEPGFTEE